MEKEIGEEKKVNVINFNEIKDRKENVVSLEEFFSTPDIRVTRGDLNQILSQVMGNIDNELMDSFKRVVITHNLVDVVVQTLVEKGLISDEDLSKAQQTLLKELEDKMEEEGKEDGTK